MEKLDEKTHSALCQRWSHLYIDGNPDMTKEQPSVFQAEFDKKKLEIENSMLIEQNDRLKLFCKDSVAKIHSFMCSYDKQQQGWVEGNNLVERYKLLEKNQ